MAGWQEEVDAARRGAEAERGPESVHKAGPRKEAGYKERGHNQIDVVGAERVASGLRPAPVFAKRCAKMTKSAELCA